MAQRRANIARRNSFSLSSATVRGPRRRLSPSVSARTTRWSSPSSCGALEAARREARGSWRPPPHSRPPCGGGPGWGVAPDSNRLIVNAGPQLRQPDADRLQYALEIAKHVVIGEPQNVESKGAK